MGGGPFGLRRRRFAVGERERLRVLVFGLVFASRAAPTLVRGRRGGIVACVGSVVVPRDATTVYEVRTTPRRHVRPGAASQRHEPAWLCERCDVRCASAVPLSRSDGVLGVLNLAAGIAHFQDGVAETSPGSARR